MTRNLYSLLESGVTVLTASRRLAYALRLGFAQHAQASGKAVWRTPQVVPWTTWLRHQWLESRSAGSGEIVHLLNGAQSRILWDEVVHASDIAGQLLNPSSAARMAALSWQRLHDYRIDLDALAASASVETQSFLTWARDFQSRCAQLGAIDEARLAQLALTAQFIPTDRVTLAGFDVLPPVLQALSSLWQRADKLVVRNEETVVLQGRTIGKLAATDRENEIELAAAWASVQADAGGQRIGVVISALQDRRHDVRRIFEDAFAPAARRVGVEHAPLPVAIAAPEPLAEYPLVAAALALLQLGNGAADSVLVGRLLRSPFISAGDSERHVRALADIRLREEQRDHWDWPTLERWAAMTDCTELQLVARRAASLVRTGSNSSLPSEWSERWVRVLRTCGWPGERMPSSVEHQTVAKFQETLGQFGTLDAILGTVSRVAALQRLRELTQDTSFEAQSRPATVTVIDPTTVAGMEFDALWVAGLDAMQLPGAASPDPFLPIELQRAAGIPQASARGMLELGGKQLQRLIDSAPRVILSWPHRDGDAELQPSALLRAIPSLAADSPARTAIQPLRNALYQQRPNLQTLTDHYAPAVASELARGGSLTVEYQSRCAFRAQAQLRLDAQPMQVVSMGIEPRERGNLLHRALEALWHELGGQQRLLQMNDAQLRSLLLEITQRTAASTLRPANRLQLRLAELEVQAIALQLFELMRLERERPPFAVRSAEFGERFALGRLSLRLRPDRIDTLADGGDLLVDYKLGESHRPRQWLDTVPGRPRRPQLPLYALAHAESVAALAFVVAAPGTVEYRGWSNGAAVARGVDTYPPRGSQRSGAPPDWPSLLMHWRTILTALADRYMAGAAEVDPLPQECRTCHLSTFCRIHEAGAGVQLDVEADDE